MLTTLTQEEMDNVLYDARFGDLETLRTIFTTEVSPEVLLTIKDEHTKVTPFHMASANGHLELLKYLLTLLPNEKKSEILNATNESGNTALHWAAYNGHVEIVQLLCDNEADPFIKNSYDHDTFYEASNNNQEKVEDYLLERYATEVEEEVQPESDENVQFNEGSEIEKVGEEDKKASEELRRKTEQLNLSE